MKTKKEFLESRLSHLLKYGLVVLRSEKAYKEFEAYAFDNGYKVESGGVMDGCSVTAFLVIHK